MPKEVRLNDKLWFGKYQGKSIKDVIDSDRGFLDNLVINGRIKYGQNVIDYIKGLSRKKSTRNWDYEDFSNDRYGESSWDNYQESMRNYNPEIDTPPLTSNTL